MRKLLLVVSAIWFVTVAPERTYGSSSDVPPVIWGISVGPTLATTTFAVGNFVYIGKGYKAPGAWRIGGYVTGALNILLGSIVLIVGPDISRASDNPKGVGADNTIGGIMIGVGVITFASAIWSSCLPSEHGEHRGPWVDVSPLLLRDSSNAIAGGVGLSVVGW